MERLKRKHNRSHRLRKKELAPEYRRCENNCAIAVARTLVEGSAGSLLKNRPKMKLIIVTFIFVGALSSPKVYTQANDFIRHVCSPQPFRLPHHVVPEHYELLMGPFREDPIIDARVDILFSINGNSSTPIALHTDNEFVGIKDVNLKTQTGAIDGGLNYCIDSRMSILLIELREPLKPGHTGTLVIEFTTRAKTMQPNVGLYLHKVERTDQLSTQDEYVFATYLEPAQARSVFPCFDEPAFKATFELTLKHRASLPVFSNTPVALTRRLDEELLLTKFEQTPRMSTYLLAFLIGNYSCPYTRPARMGLPKLRVCEHHLALGGDNGEMLIDAAERGFMEMQEFFGVEFPIGKLDIVGTRFPPIGMENYGLIMLHSNRMFVDKPIVRVERWERQVREQTELILHEICHQWMGNLVTMKWWSEIWLKEAFCDWYGQFVADIVRPGYQVLDHAKVRAALYSPLRTRALRVTDLRTRADLSNFYDESIYLVSASVMQALRELVGPKVFRDSVRAFVRMYKFRNAEIKDLIGIMEAYSGLNLHKFVDSWLDTPATPLIVVQYDAKLNALILEQRRFSRNSTTDDLWKVPSKILVSNGLNHTVVFNFLLEQKQLKLKLPDWFHGFRGTRNFIKLNPGFVSPYSTLYSEEIFENLRPLLNGSSLLASVDWVEIVSHRKSQKELGLLGPPNVAI